MIILSDPRCRQLRFDGDHHRFAVSKANVVALQCAGGGQHDVCVFGQCVPDLFMNDHGGRLAPGVAQAVDVLMVVKGISTGPVDQIDVGIATGKPVELVCPTRIQKHVADASYWYHTGDRIWRKRQAWSWLQQTMWAAGAVFAPITDAKTATRQTNLSQYGGQGNQCPVGLLPMLGALQRPRSVDHAAAAVCGLAHLQG